MTLKVERCNSDICVHRTCISCLVCMHCVLNNGKNLGKGKLTDQQQCSLLHSVCAKKHWKNLMLYNGRTSLPRTKTRNVIPKNLCVMQAKKAACH
eukprot:10450279-Ditylum_brightwellii.AAC.1